jgi:hypothetical protein
MEEEYYSPIRKSTERALKKLYMTILKGEYPEIKGIVISSTDMGFVITYRVGIGLMYDDLPANDDDRLKNRVKELSKYVLDKNGLLENVYYYDPNS